MSASLATASTVEQALAQLAAGARPVAGGTDLVVGARQGKAPLPERLVAIHRLAELSEIRESSTEVALGALVSHRRCSESGTVRGRLTALADACAIVGSIATRTTGTLGGNLMNASPAMETGGPLLCFGASVTLRSAAGSRSLGIDELLAGPGRTTAASDELLEAVSVPLPPAGTGSCYARLEYRRQMEIAIAGATAVVTLANGEVTDARIAMTALSPAIGRAGEAEAALIGSGGEPDAIRRAAQALAAAASPISDVRASASYRRAMAVVIGRRAIEAALARARGEWVPVPASTALHGGVR